MISGHNQSNRSMTSIKLNLSRHCIQTEIKRIYNKTVSDYFREDPDKQYLEVKIELLKKALESFDFQKLRVTYTELAGGSDDEVYLETDPDNEIRIRINEVPIQP